MKPPEIWKGKKRINTPGGEAYLITDKLEPLIQSVPEIWAARKRIPVSSENGITQKRNLLCRTEQGYSVPEIWKGTKRIRTLNNGVVQILERLLTGQKQGTQEAENAEFETDTRIEHERRSGGSLLRTAQ